MQAISITRAIGSGGLLEIETFLGPEMATSRANVIDLIDTVLYIMLLMRANPLLGKMGKGLGPGSQFLLAPNGTRLTARCYFKGPKQFLISRAQPLPTCPRITYEAV